MTGRPQIGTVADAIAFLEGQCACLVVQLEIVPPLWKVVSIDGAFEALLGDAELIQHARAEPPAEAGPSGDGAVNQSPDAGGGGA
jgi:hypothetical protein